MTKKTPDSRRKLLKSIAAGSGAIVAGKSLPESWSKPVVDAVMLPAHAETTDDTGSGSPEVTTTAAPTCCDGYVCRLVFGQGVPISGSAVLSNCTITFEGSAPDTTWGGSGAIAADGSFSFTVVFTPDDGTPYNIPISGTVLPSCLSISGVLVGDGEVTFTGDIGTSPCDG